MTTRHQPLVGLAIVSAGVTGVGVWVTYHLELALLQTAVAPFQPLAVGLVEESFVRFVPLIVVFYLWSYRQGRLLTKTEGLVATIVSGLTVAGLEVVLKLQFLSYVEETARLDALGLPILFVHIPFALVAGRFVYALGERIHGHDTVGVPSPSPRTIAILAAGYLLLALAHVGYNIVF
ncbi:hypothetical protein [Haloferax sp. DFSO52]|uniref:hypothetical protein n=1 Tax=Haloferax sp. DFSO52 TaxID=3388505 RepID=UPI003A8BF621